LIIDGKAIAQRLRNEVQEMVTSRCQQGHRAPGLATVLVGDDAASELYIKYKRRAAEGCGIKSHHYPLHKSTSEVELLERIERLNNDDEIDAILVQLPLPAHINKEDILSAIAPEKDVDGFHPLNVARLSLGHPCFVPCTPLGCLYLLKEVGVTLSGARAVVIGRSDIVGKPMLQLLLAEDATVTLAHSKTSDLKTLTQSADIIICAVGQKHIISKEHVQEGAVVIDVGITRGDDGKVYGDVDFESVKKVAKYITPVPGGVGPMTIAMLMKNTCDAHAQILNLNSSQKVSQ